MWRSATSNPQAPTHILLIPKEHIRVDRGDRGTATRDMLADVEQAATQLAHAEGIDESGGGS